MLFGLMSLFLFLIFDLERQQYQVQRYGGQVGDDDGHLPDHEPVDGPQGKADYHQYQKPDIEIIHVLGFQTFYYLRQKAEGGQKTCQ
jgi:hypothetical protein